MRSCNQDLSTVQEKREKLKRIIGSCDSLAVAFSGGVDSALLLAVAHEVLGERVIAVTATSAAFPAREEAEAKAFCEARGIRQIQIVVDPLEVEDFRKNTAERCYHCKRMIFSEIVRAAKESGAKHVAEGSNLDDRSDFRPGMRAVEELGVISPLMEAGLYKEEIRHLAEEMGLPCFDKPAYACLATRIAAGEEITKEKLGMIERAEAFLIGQGFPAERVRMHGDLARIELLPDDFGRIFAGDLREMICEELERIGFRHVTLDLRGYRRGSTNATLSQKA